MPKRNNILLIVQNNSFPFDTRVRKEALTLKNNGYKVTVISPNSEINPENKTTYHDIEVIRFKNYLSDGSIIGFLREYAVSLIAIYSLFVFQHIKKHFVSVHVANPPDLFWPLALICKITKTKFIFDQHDLVPETYKNKFGPGLVYKLLLFNERLTVSLADAVITVNDSLHKRLKRLWGNKGKKYTVVYNSPSSSFHTRKNNELVEKYTGKKILLYVGLMTKNDDVDLIIRAADILIHEKKMINYRFVLLGGGDVEDNLKSLTDKLGLKDYIEFAGIVDQTKVMEYLYIADLCIAPDQPDGLIEYIAPVKIMEYMKAGKPFVSFVLPEIQKIALESGLYAVDFNDFLDKVIYLINNPYDAERMGQFGKKRVEEYFSWDCSEKNLLGIYKTLLNI